MSNRKYKNTESQNTETEAGHEEHLEKEVNSAQESSAGHAELSEIEAMTAEMNNWREKYMRLYAEFDNFRKRTIKEKSEIISTAGAETIRALLPVLDDFERAIAAAANGADAASIFEGMDLIHKKMSHNLKSKGLEPIESKGLAFDADLHEAITTIPAPTPDMVGKVIDETEKGYRLNGHVIRFSKVVVGQ